MTSQPSALPKIQPSEPASRVDAAMRRWRRRAITKSVSPSPKPGQGPRGLMPRVATQAASTLGTRRRSREVQNLRMGAPPQVAKALVRQEWKKTGSSSY